MHVLQLGTVIRVLSWSYIVNSQYGLYCRNLLFSYLPALKSKKITYNIEQDSNSAFIVVFFCCFFFVVFFCLYFLWHYHQKGQYILVLSQAKPESLEV